MPSSSVSVRAPPPRRRRWRERSERPGSAWTDRSRRDLSGRVHVVAHPDDAPEAFRAASEAKLESVVLVRGEVRLRPEGTANPGLATGEVEVAAGEIEVLSMSDTPPFPVEDDVQVEEALRL